MRSTSIEAIIIFLIAATFLIIAMAAFISIVVFRYLHRQNLHIKDIKELKTAHDNKILQTQLEIQEQTFQNISQEIHDNIGLSLTLVKLNLNTLSLKNGTEAQQKIDNSVELLGKSIHDLAWLGKRLNAGFLESHGFIKAVENELEYINKTGVIKTEMNIAGDPVFLTSKKELLLFRIVQEALNNIIKHAAANILTVTLHFNNSGLEVSVADDGRGLPNHNTDYKKTGSGLNNMQERAKMLEGHCIIKNNKISGTTVFIKIPY